MLSIHDAAELLAHIQTTLATLVPSARLLSIKFPQETSAMAIVTVDAPAWPFTAAAPIRSSNGDAPPIGDPNDLCHIDDHGVVWKVIQRPIRDELPTIATLHMVQRSPTIWTGTVNDGRYLYCEWGRDRRVRFGLGETIAIAFANRRCIGVELDLGRGAHLTERVLRAVLSGRLRWRTRV